MALSRLLHRSSDSGAPDLDLSLASAEPQLVELRAQAKKLAARRAELRERMEPIAEKLRASGGDIQKGAGVPAGVREALGRVGAAALATQEKTDDASDYSAMSRE